MTPLKTSVADGLSVTVRDVGPGDRDLIETGFDQLSPESRYFRFMAARRVLTSKELLDFSEINTWDHAAIAASCMSTAGTQPVGIARYIRLPEDPTRAECAITVVDRFHNRGIGRLLMGCLSEHAKAHDIHAFIATVHRNNTAMRHLLHTHGAKVETRTPELTLVMPLCGDPEDDTGNFTDRSTDRSSSQVWLR